MLINNNVKCSVQCSMCSKILLQLYTHVQHVDQKRRGAERRLHAHSRYINVQQSRAHSMLIYQTSAQQRYIGGQLNFADKFHKNVREIKTNRNILQNFAQKSRFHTGSNFAKENFMISPRQSNDSNFVPTLLHRNKRTEIYTIFAVWCKIYLYTS